MTTPALPAVTPPLVPPTFLNPHRPRPWHRGLWYCGSWHTFSRRLGVGALCLKLFAASTDWPAHIPRCPPWTHEEARDVARAWRIRRRCRER